MYDTFETVKLKECCLENPVSSHCALPWFSWDSLHNWYANPQEQSQNISDPDKLSYKLLVSVENKQKN